MMSMKNDRDDESTMLRFITANKASISCITDKLALGLRLGRVRVRIRVRSE